MFLSVGARPLGPVMVSVQELVPEEVGPESSRGAAAKRQTENSRSRVAAAICQAVKQEIHPRTHRGYLLIRRGFR